MKPTVTPSDGTAVLNGYRSPQRNAMIGNTSPGHLLSLLDKKICNTITPTMKSKTTKALMIYTFP